MYPTISSSDQSYLPPPPPGKTTWPWTKVTQPTPLTMVDGSLWPRIHVVDSIL